MKGPIGYKAIICIIVCCVIAIGLISHAQLSQTDEASSPLYELMAAQTAEGFGLAPSGSANSIFEFGSVDTADLTVTKQLGTQYECITKTKTTEVDCSPRPKTAEVDCNPRPPSSQQECIRTAHNCPTPTSQDCLETSYNCPTPETTFNCPTPETTFNCPTPTPATISLGCVIPVAVTLSACPIVATATLCYGPTPTPTPPPESLINIFTQVNGDQIHEFEYGDAME